MILVVHSLLTAITVVKRFIDYCIGYWICKKLNYCVMEWILCLSKHNYWIIGILLGKFAAWSMALYCLLDTAGRVLEFIVLEAKSVIGTHA